MAGYYKAEDVRKEANGRWPSILGTLGVQTESLENRHGPCPGCGGRDRFRWDDKDGEGTWLCSQGGGGTISGDGIALLMHVTGKEWKECVNMVGELVLGEKGRHHSMRKVEEGVVTREPKRKETWVPDFNPRKLAGLVTGLDAVNERWFEERSPVDVRTMTPGGFIEHLYRPGEKVLIFTNYKSQGDYLWEVGKGGFRLSSQQEVAPVPSKLPVDGGKDGVWFLNQPVDGCWHEHLVDANQRKYSRRSGKAVTSWRFMLLESDEADAGQWLRLLAMCCLPIAAIYSSGGRSWHALLNVQSRNLDEMRMTIRAYKEELPRVGADSNAMTPVRLTRLPGCTRGGRMQRLIFLNPGATGIPVTEMRRVRSV